jgi:hypothetical protein
MPPVSNSPVNMPPEEHLRIIPFRAEQQMRMLARTAKGQVRIAYTKVSVPEEQLWATGACSILDVITFRKITSSLIQETS